MPNISLNKAEYSYILWLISVDMLKDTITKDQLKKSMVQNLMDKLILANKKEK